MDVDREFLFREICDIIQNMCYIDFHDLHNFVVTPDKYDREYRLAGKFGMGFKLMRNGKDYKFTQYKEDETKESIQWIKDNNQYLSELCNRVN